MRQLLMTPQMERDGYPAWIDRRREKRYHRMSQSVVAYYRGSSDGDWMTAPKNPYPPGIRHDEYERGFRSADPMGDHHGRNV